MEKIVIVDENNNIIKTVAQKEAKDGKDIRLTIDIDLQQSLYNEYQNDKSASVALNPKNRRSFSTCINTILFKIMTLF